MPLYTTAGGVSIHAPTHAAGASDALAGNLNANARVAVRVNSAVSVSGTRRELNFIPGANMSSIVAADDVANERMTLTFNAAAGSGGTVSNAYRKRPTSKNVGFWDWGSPTIFPSVSAGYGYAGGSGYSFVSEGAASTIQTQGYDQYHVYKTFYEANSLAGAVPSRSNGYESAPFSLYQPELETASDILNVLLRQEWFNAVWPTGEGLLKKAGADLIAPLYGTTVPNLGREDVRRALARAAIAQARRMGFRDFFFDTVNTHVTDLGGMTSRPDGVWSEQDWEMRFFRPAVRDICLKIKQAGLGVTVNGNSWGSVQNGSDTGYPDNYDRGDPRQRHYRFLSDYVTGVCTEYYAQGVDNEPLNDMIGADPSNGAINYKSWWRFHLSEVGAAQAAGLDFYGVVYPSATRGQSYRFSRGTMLLTWDGYSRQVMVAFQDSTAADTTPSFLYDPGYPLRPCVWLYGTNEYLWKRWFDNGTLILNSGPTASITYAGKSVPAMDAIFYPGEWL